MAEDRASWGGEDIKRALSTCDLPFPSCRACLSRCPALAKLLGGGEGPDKVNGRQLGTWYFV